MSTIFLAKFLGLIMVVLSLVYLLKRESFDFVLKLNENKITILVKGLLCIILGIFLVLDHNVWTTNLDISITLLGWLFLVGGLVGLFFPSSSISMNLAHDLRKNKTLRTIVLVAVLVIGLYFTYAGFTY